MAKYRVWHELRPKSWGELEYIYLLVGAKGGLHLHIHDRAEPDEYGPSGGLEIHYRSPPDYMRDQAPSHDECHVLKAPCWHDGTSLYVSEVVIPYWNSCGRDPIKMLQWLECEADCRFAEEDR